MNEKRETEASPPVSYRPDLPDWGSYLRWPEGNDQWIHEEDLALANQLLPSRRILKRFKWDGEFYWLNYGACILRVRPTMWTRVPDLDLEVGQKIELLHRHGQNDPGIFRIHEIFYSERRKAPEFFLRRGEMILEKAFLRVDIRPLHVQHKLRSGFYQHKPQQLDPSSSVDKLDVGDLGSFDH
ncbi:MAG: hypothetical protein NXI32_30350 [bacterium]|nr:hypothetical protein [bacterium]